jgi:hypothetical protein
MVQAGMSVTAQPNHRSYIKSLYLPAPGLDDTDLSESGLPLELHRA